MCKKKYIRRNEWNMKKLKCASFFAGVGGIDLGFEQTNLFETIYANEVDKYPIETYESNFNIKVDCRSIEAVSYTHLDVYKRQQLYFQVLKVLNLQQKWHQPNW